MNLTLLIDLDLVEVPAVMLTSVLDVDLHEVLVAVLEVARSHAQHALAQSRRRVGGCQQTIIPCMPDDV